VIASLLAAAVLAAPIPSSPISGAPAFAGAPAKARPISAPPVPQHPHMAPNGSSLLHEDAWQTDASTRSGPLGRDIEVTSTFFSRECASVTFDSRGRIVSVCVGLDRPQAVILDPRTLDTIDALDLPPRPVGAGNPFTGFGGGGYFYLDDRDRAIVPTTDRHVYVLHAGDTLERVGDYDLSAVVGEGDSIVSVLPDWSGVLWFASRDGVVGTLDMATGAIASIELEPIGNSFATGENGGVYIVTDAALYRLVLGRDGTPVQRWRREYANTGDTKPGQTQAGSGTTPTLMARRLVAITDNADPINVVVYTRSGRELCRTPVFEPGASSTDQSLIAVGRSLIAENNYGYTGPAATEGGGTTTPGLERVQISKDLERCRSVWRSDETAPSVVPKASLANGLVYTYTKPGGDASDPWYLTALDFRTGRTVFKALAGGGLGFNNNYAPVSIGPDGTAYVGVLGGLVALRDARPPAQPKRRPRPRLRVAGCVRRPRLAGRDTDWVRRVRFERTGRRRVTARIVLTDGRAVRRVGRNLPRRCGSGLSQDPAATGG
jgi:hypothetical protein